MQQQTPQLLTVKETARLLRQTPWSVRQKIARGEIPALRVGLGPRAPIRVDAGELEQFLYGIPSGPPEAPGRFVPERPGALGAP